MGHSKFDLFDLAGGHDFLRCCDDCGSILARCALVIPTLIIPRELSHGESAWYKDMYIYTHTHEHIYIYIHIHLCMCGYAYMYMYMYCIYIYTYRHLCHHPPASNAQIIFNPNLLAIFVAFEIALFPTWIFLTCRGLVFRWRGLEEMVDGLWHRLPWCHRNLPQLGKFEFFHDFMAEKIGWQWRQWPMNHGADLIFFFGQNRPDITNFCSLDLRFWGNFPLSMCQTSQLLFQGIETACFSADQTDLVSYCFVTWSRNLYWISKK